MQSINQRLWRIIVNQGWAYILVTVVMHCLLLNASPARAADENLLQQISAQIEQHQVIRASFSQNKQMAAMKRPLLTEGKLVYSSTYGVLWQIDQPYRVSYLLGEDRIIEIAADGSRKLRGTRDIPGLAQVGRVFRAMLAANTSTLQNHFSIEASGSLAQWNIALRPKQAQIQQFLSLLTLSGGKFVESISIEEASGDRTQIRFHHITPLSTPDAAELQLLQSLKAP